MQGFKIMLGAIGVQLVVMGAITALKALGVFGAQPSGPNAALIGAVMIASGVALALWPILSGAQRDLAGASSVLFAVFGTVWILQGLNIVPGSFMSGAILWTYIGAVWVMIAAALFIYGLKKPKLAS